MIPAGPDRWSRHPKGSTLSYTNTTRSLVPIPASERDLPTATAEPYYKVSDDLVALEGPAFDRLGNLLFVDVYGGRILRLPSDRRLTIVYTDDQRDLVIVARDEVGGRGSWISAKGLAEGFPMFSHQ